MSRRRRLILFTRFPVSGRAKTRLVPALGPEGAAGLQRRLTLRTVRAARAAAEMSDFQIEVRFDGGAEGAIRDWLGDGPLYREQGEGDLGERMRRAFETGFREGASAVVVIGADCPELTPALLNEAFGQLCLNPVVLGPATDGGYYLLGLRELVPQLFSRITWGTDTVLASSLAVLERANLAPYLLPRLSDIDRPEDLPCWQRIVQVEEAEPGSISVIIPVLNEAQEIVQVITAAAAGAPGEIIVVDGGSADKTVELAQQTGARVLHARPGRGRQMNYGAALASGSILLFVHGDTFLPSDYANSVRTRLKEREVAAGAFSFQARGGFPGRRLLETAVNLRSRLLHRPYGDQGLFVRRALFEELGGFAALPLLEDYELVSRLRRSGRVITLPLKASTSGRRWRRLGWLRCTALNQLILVGFHLGWPVERLAAIYQNRSLPKNRKLGQSQGSAEQR